MITFKEIEMIGFKSFADDTRISFDGGITAIVGPNGCGKSNVSDAIRWVLGEQSSKALRGKTMQDVIFAGTEKRKQLSYCEVSLVFDNTNRWFNVEYDEVVITRKLYRSGESDYLINRQPARLKDIHDMLYDSGIGKDGYSIIGQGRVEEIISSKPEDRRAIFEEAAGIAKFKSRKTETENRLARVRDNLSRANDIMTEVERRLGPLRQQSEDAKKYLEYKEILKQHEINSYIFQYDNAEKAKQEINTKLAGYRDNLNVAQESFEAEQAKYDKTFNEIKSLDGESNALHEQILEKTVTLQKFEGDSQLLNEQTRHIKDDLERLKNQLNAYSLDLNQRTALLNSAMASYEEQSSKLAKLNLDSQNMSQKYITLVDEITKTDVEKEKNQREMLDNISQITNIKANLSAYIAKRDAMLENIKNDTERLNKLLAQQKDLTEELNKCSKEVETLQNNKQTTEEEIAHFTEKLNVLTGAISSLNEEAYVFKTSISNDTNRKTILSNLQADFEGYQFAVKRLLQDGKTNVRLSSAIKGVVGNIIDVEEKFQTAIEIALGGNIQNIVTQNEEDAKTLISYLKEAKLGRATFLPVSAVKVRSLSANDRQYLNTNGCLGVASELVKCEAYYKPVVESLLGATVVCDTLDNAVNLAKRSGYSFRIVTLEGDLLSPQGSMSGGSKKNNDSMLLGKDNEIKQLSAHIEESNKKLHEVEGKLAEYNAALTKLNTKLDLDKIELQDISNNFYANNTKLEGLKNSSTDLEEEIFSLKSQITVANKYVEDLNKDIDSTDQLEINFDASNKQAVSLEITAYEELKKKREEYAEEGTKLRVEIAAIGEQLKSLNKEIETQTEEIKILKQNIEKTNAEIASQQRIFDEVLNLNQSKTERDNSAKVQEELKILNDKISNFDKHKSSLMEELKTLDERKNELNAEITKLNTRIGQEEAKLQNVDINVENLQERIYEEYELTYTDCLKYKTIDENFDIKETSIAINKIKNQITALGMINVNAIEEYKTEGARYEEMNAQIEDLKKAEEDALKIIKDLSTEMLQKFNTEFAKIQANFTHVFKELFGGGNARLELLPSEDPLTAGVDIIAEPPGKKLQHISLLSGGEKTMTAIAILFAILKLKPMPFCFLDEIEAALDDANIERYAKYLKRFSDDTQFIVITHRKPTMELSDYLYGVTMEEGGISKVVSVKLTDALKVAEEPKEE